MYWTHLLKWLLQNYRVQWLWCSRAGSGEPHVGGAGQGRVPGLPRAVQAVHPHRGCDHAHGLHSPARQGALPSRARLFMGPQTRGC